MKYLLMSTMLFAVFVINVVMGATQSSPFLNDVSEMLLLVAVSALFVTGILREETQAASKKTSKTEGNR